MEVLIAVIILGIAGVAILNSITTADKVGAKVSAKATGFNSLAAAAQLLQAAAWKDCGAGDTVPAAYLALKRPSGVSLTSCKESRGSQTLTLTYVPTPNPDDLPAATRVVFKTNRLATQLLTLVVTVNGQETATEAELLLPAERTTTISPTCTGANEVRISATNRDSARDYQLYFFDFDGAATPFSPETTALMQDPFTCAAVAVPAVGQTVRYTIGAVDIAAPAGKPNEAKAIVLMVTGR